MYTSAHCKLSKDGSYGNYCFISEVAYKESEADAQKMRTRLQNDIQILYPDISQLPTAIPAPIRYNTLSEAEDARSNTVAYFTRSNNKIIWVKRP